MTNELIVAKIIEIQAANPALYLGLRWHHGICGCKTWKDDEEFTPLRVGDVAPTSYEWDDGEPTDVELNGTSCIDLDKYTVEEAVKMATSYDDYGPGQLVLLGSKDAGWMGQDVCETVFDIDTTTVLATF